MRAPHDVHPALVRDHALPVDDDGAIERACDQVHELIPSHDHQRRRYHSPAPLRICKLRGTARSFLHNDAVELEGRAEALLLAIRAAPDDTATRLVFADHIAPRFPAHAAWIVAQCTGVEDPALEAAFRDELPEPLRELATTRGFVRGATWQLEARDFVELHPDVLFRLSPFRTGIALQDATRYAAIAARMRRFDALTLVATHLDVAGAHELATVDGLTHLRHLGFDHMRIDDENLAVLLAATSFPVLESLSLSGQGNPVRFSIETLRRLPQATFASSLRSLDVSSCYLTDLVEVLRELPALRTLAATHSRLDASFATLPLRFERLNLDFCGIDDATAQAVARSRVLSQLQALSAIGNKWTCSGIHDVLASPNLGPLRELTLDVVGGDDGLLVSSALARSTARGTLERVVFSMMRLGDDAARVLADRTSNTSRLSSATSDVAGSRPS